MFRNESCYFEKEFYSAGSLVNLLQWGWLRNAFLQILPFTHVCVKWYSLTISNISKPTFTNTESVVALRRRWSLYSLNGCNIEVEIQQISTKTNPVGRESNMLFTLGELLIFMKYYIFHLNWLFFYLFGFHFNTLVRTY